MTSSTLTQDVCMTTMIFIRSRTVGQLLHFPSFPKRLHHSHLHNSPLSGLRQAPQCPPCLAFIISFHDNFMTISYELKSFFVLNDLGLQPFLQIRAQGGKKDVCVIGRWLLTHQAAHFLSLPHATGNELCPHNLYITKQTH